MRYWKSLPLGLLLVTLAACSSLPFPLPRLVWETPGPTPTLNTGPTATPLPQALIQFTVHTPANTPPGSAPALQLIDEVSGDSTTVVLTSAGSNAWTGCFPTIVGAVLRYRYIRPLPTRVEETTPARQPVAYRLVAVTASALNVEDTVAAWTDTPYAGDLGSVRGTVKNSNSGQGVGGLLVAAGGHVTLAAGGGGLALFRL